MSAGTASKYVPPPMRAQQIALSGHAVGAGRPNHAAAQFPVPSPAPPQANMPGAATAPGFMGHFQAPNANFTPLSNARGWTSSHAAQQPLTNGGLNPAAAAFTAPQPLTWRPSQRSLPPKTGRIVLKPGMIVWIPESVGLDTTSRLHHNLDPGRRPWSHAAIVNSIDNGIVSVYLCSSFKEKTNGATARTAVRDMFPNDSSAQVCRERSRYCLIRDSRSLYDRQYDNPELLVPPLSLDSAIEFPRVTYVNVERLYEVELHHLRWHSQLAPRCALHPNSLTHLRNWADHFGTYIMPEILQERGLRKLLGWP